MTKTETKRRASGSQLPGPADKPDSSESEALPADVQGITGAGFVLVDYLPPAKPPVNRLISSQFITGDQKS